MIYLQPILPNMAKEVQQFLNIEQLKWEHSKTPLLNHKINKFQPLMQRVDVGLL
jgi:methionyl-tRNA synthetase